MWSYGPPPLCLLTVWEGGVCRPYTNIWIFEYMQICKYANMQICKYANMQIFKYSNIQIFKYSNIQIFKFLYVIFWPPPLCLMFWIFEYMQVFKYLCVIVWYPLPLCLLIVDLNIWIYEWMKWWIFEYTQLFEYFEICRYSAYWCGFLNTCIFANMQIFWNRL